MRDHLAAANHTTAAAMSAHADVLWDARCGDPTVSHLVDANTTAVAAMNISRDSRRRSPDRRSPDRRRRQSRPGHRPTPGPDSRGVPEDWNKIPPVVKNAETVKAFRNAFRKHRLPEAAA